MFHIESCHCLALLPDIPVGDQDIRPEPSFGSVQKGWGIRSWRAVERVVRKKLFGDAVKRSSGSLWRMPSGKFRRRRASLDLFIASRDLSQLFDPLSPPRTSSWSLDNDAQTGGPHPNAPEMNLIGAVTAQGCRGLIRINRSAPSVHNHFAPITTSNGRFEFFLPPRQNILHLPHLESAPLGKRVGREESETGTHTFQG